MKCENCGAVHPDDLWDFCAVCSQNLCESCMRKRTCDGGAAHASNALPRRGR